MDTINEYQWISKWISMDLQMNINGFPSMNSMMAHQWIWSPSFGFLSLGLSLVPIGPPLAPMENQGGGSEHCTLARNHRDNRQFRWGLCIFSTGFPFEVLESVMNKPWPPIKTITFTRVFVWEKQKMPEATNEKNRAFGHQTFRGSSLVKNKLWTFIFKITSVPVVGPSRQPSVLVVGPSRQPSVPVVGLQKTTKQTVCGTMNTHKNS